MLETSRICGVLMLAMLASCVEAPPKPEASASEAAARLAPTVPAGPTEAERKAAQMEEARALLAQAETDIQRARAKRALWQKAWEDLVAARQAVGSGDAPRAIRLAHRASELAQLGLEQLAYPAVQ
jgi:hypothetical protein